MTATIKQQQRKCLNNKRSMVKFRLHKIQFWVLFLAVNLMILGLFYWAPNNTSPSDEWYYSNHLKLDTAGAPIERELYARVAQQLPALPLEQLLEFEKMGFALNSTCAHYPQLRNIKFYNNYWQSYEAPDATIRLFSAYYDKRAAVPQAPLVSILAMINAFNYATNATYCQIWFNGLNKPAIVPTSDFKMIWVKEWNSIPEQLYPHLFACKIPERNKHHIPQTVSLVRDPCEHATNSLKVNYELPQNDVQEQQGFAVCIKAINFKYADISVRLIEWIEVQRQLGARLITIYNYQLHPNVTHVLEHYQNTGFVDVRPFAFASGEPNIGDFGPIAWSNDFHNRILHEVITYTDCFYRNMYKYEFISAQDIDEVIMPLGKLTDWHKLFDFVRGWPSESCKIRRYSSYCFRNVYFPSFTEKKAIFSDIPEYFYMLQHVERMEYHSEPKIATKCFHSTAYVVTVHNHHPIHYVESCYPLSVNVTLAQLQHYREPQGKVLEGIPVYDDSLLRFKRDIMNRSLIVLEKLGFLNKGSTI